ncbi:hypothetical protein [Erwinia persicina]|uniref:hypothetical protein n=1 Tax=Erwinia persicina TaxID=55211 RepID=UPI001F0743C5|nr:hypothetical protein [Erwinia persicina]
MAIPKDAEVKNYRGKSVLPGLISDHAHLAQYQGVTPSPDAYTRENILSQFKTYQTYGITTVMSLGVNRPLFYEISNSQHSGRSQGTDIFGSGHGIGVPQDGPPVNVGPDQLDRPATPEEARKAIKAALVDELAESMDSIALSSAEQMQGISQVSIAVSQMDGVTQNNSALVEESSTASQALSKQAHSLQLIVETFKV